MRRSRPLKSYGDEVADLACHVVADYHYEYSKFKMGKEVYQKAIKESLIHAIQPEWRAVPHPDQPEGCLFMIQFSSDGSLLASSTETSEVDIWDMDTRERIHSLNAHNEIVTSLEFMHQHSNQFYTCSLDKTIKLWKDYDVQYTLEDHKDWIRCIGVSKDDKRLISGCVSSTICGWDTERGKVLFKIQNPVDSQFLNTINALSFSHRSCDTFLSGSRDGYVKLHDFRTPETSVLRFFAHTTKLNSVLFNQNDQCLLSAGRDSKARLWDIRSIDQKSTNPTDHCITEYGGYRCGGYNILCSYFNDENHVITGSEDSHIYIFEKNTSELVRKIKTDSKVVHLVKPIPGGTPLSIAFSGLQQSSINFWGISGPTDENINNTLLKNIEVDTTKRFSSNKFDHSTTMSTTLDDDTTDLSHGHKSDILRSERTYSAEEDLEEGSADDEENDMDLQNEMYMNLIEDLMSSHGDIILKIFHRNNLTYSPGMNWESLIQIINSTNDPESVELLETLNQHFIRRLNEYIRQRGNPVLQGAAETESSFSSWGASTRDEENQDLMLERERSEEILQNNHTRLHELVKSTDQFERKEFVQGSTLNNSSQEVMDMSQTDSLEVISALKTLPNLSNAFMDCVYKRA